MFDTCGLADGLFAWPGYENRLVEDSHTDPKREVFDYLLKRGDLSGAWLTLNSPGWVMREAGESIRRLAAPGRDEGFDRLVEAWLGMVEDEEVAW